MMFLRWSFGRVVAVGLSIIAALTLICSGVSVFALRSAVQAKEQMISEQIGRQFAVERIRLAREQRARAIRSYLLTVNEQYLEQMRDRNSDLLAKVDVLRSGSISAVERQTLDRFADANTRILTSWEQVAAMRRSGAPLDEVVDAFERGGAPRVKAVDDALSALAGYEDERFRVAQQVSSESSSRSSNLVIGIAALTSLSAFALVVLLRLFLTRQIGGVIKDVQGSSVDLASAAQDQVASAERLTVVTAEITTTIHELLATSRQISESAQRVTMAAEETAAGASAGDDTVLQTQDAIVSIKQQVDVIVSHMLDLDRKFQEIGAILDLIREFAEQTNILSINATIEAAGAGAAGKRFAVVADEIQRLADRVGGGAREIFQLIDEIRRAASATMEATEEGKRAVDNGARQFNEVLATFKQISVKSSVTTDAAREIELSTKQQTSAVEQVSVAIAGVGRAARDSQQSSGRTVTTSEKLAEISHRLTRIIREEVPRAAPAEGKSPADDSDEPASKE